MQSKIKSYFKSKRIESLKKNYLSSFYIKLVSLFLFFSTPKLILLNTDSNTYGLFILIISLGAIFSLLDIGVGNSLRNKIAKLNSLNKKKQIIPFVTSSYFFIVIICLICLIFLTIFWKNLKWDYFIYNSNTSFENIDQIINIFVFYSIFSIFLKNINFLLFSIHKSYLVDLIDILSKLIFFIILLLLYLNNTYVELFTLIKIQIFSFLTVLIISNILFFKISSIKIRFKSFKFSNLLKILKNGISFFILQISSIILLFSDKILVSKFFITSEITNYFLTGQIYIFLIMFFNFLNVPLWSSFTEAFSKKDLKWIIYTFAFELLILLIFIFLSFVIYKFSFDILNFWIGDKVEYDNSLSFFWMVFVILRCCNVIFTNFLNGANIIKFQVYLGLFTMLLNIPLSIYFALDLEFGPKGILIGSICCITISLIVKIFYSLNSLNFIKKN